MTTPTDDAHSHLLVSGTPVSPGIALGYAKVRTSGLDDIAVHKILDADVDQEIERFHGALDGTKKQLAETQRVLEDERILSKHEISIFEAHSACLDDPVFRSDVEKGIRDEKLNVEGALARVISNFARIFELVENSHLKERISDIREVASRILDHLRGPEGTAPLDLEEGPQVLVTEELRLADLVSAKDRRFVAVVSERGTRTGHASLMARSLRIPMVTGVPDAVDRLVDGTPLLVDGSVGTVYPDPPAEVREGYQEFDRGTDRDDGVATEEPRTSDGTRIHLYASASNPTDLALVRSFGMDGIGLYRTDTPFLQGTSLPREDDLTKIYSGVSEAAGDDPAVIRLVNVGSARGIAGRQIVREANPALGRRGVRLLLEDAEILKLQVRALMRANARGNLRLLLPFVSELADVRSARKLVEAQARDLVSEGHEARVPSIGCVVEVPGLLPVIRPLTEEVDFLTIAIDNLAQYMMAADRVNGEVASYLDFCQPGILRSLHDILDEAGTRIPIAAYGEMVRDHRYTYLLLGLGLTKFCLPPYSLPRIRTLVANTDRDEAAAFARDVLKLDTKEAIRRALDEQTTRVLNAAERV